MILEHVAMACSDFSVKSDHFVQPFFVASGFTKCSSVRTPAQVFGLLEALYASFDAAANKHRVYKIETIGKF